MINNLTESDWLSSTAFALAIMTLATFALARSALEQRWRMQIRPAPAPAAAVAAPARSGRGPGRFARPDTR